MMFLVVNHRAFFFLMAREYLEPRFRDLKVQEKPFLRVGVEVSPANDPSVQSTQENFAKAANSIPTSPAFWSFQQRPLSFEEIEESQRKLGKSRRLAAASGPNVALVWPNWLHV